MRNRRRICWLLSVLLAFAICDVVGSAAADDTRADEIEAVNLRPVLEQAGLTARAQGDRNTCSVFTVVGAIEFALAKSGRETDRLSVEFLNWSSDQVVGKARDGSFFSDAWKGFEKYGLCPESAMPYGKRFEPERRPSDEALNQAKRLREARLTLHWIKRWDPNKGLTDDQFNAVKATLRAGWPVCGGFLWPKKADWKDDVLQMAPRDGVRDGHSVLLIGYRDDPNQRGGGVFLIRNSSRGPRHGAMSYEYVRTYMNDGVWVESKR